MSEVLLITNGYVQAAILAHLAQVGADTNKRITAVLNRRYSIDQSCVNAALCRMSKRGLVTRVRSGVYELGSKGQYRAGVPAFLVSAVLDKLFTEHAETVAVELRKRGWERHNGCRDRSGLL